MYSMVEIIKIVTVLTILSLVCAFTLFKVLKSSAVVKTKQGLAKGAIGGFILVFGTLSGLTLKLTDKQPVEQMVEWSIDGSVEADDEHADLTHINIAQFPMTNADSAGTFALRGIPSPRNKLPRLYIQGEHYYPYSRPITKDLADIDSGTHEISFRRAIPLTRITMAGGSLPATLGGGK